MAVYSDREAFIPYRRGDLISLCLEDGELKSTDVPSFRLFCELVSAYYHFQFHSDLEKLKDNYAPFNPDADTKFISYPEPHQQAEMAHQLVTDFETLLARANYVSLSPASLQRAFKEKSLLELNTQVDFNDFDCMVCYCRGDTYKVTEVKKFFRKLQQTVDVFERVVLLLRFKDSANFINKKAKRDSLGFKPGKIYVYLYKNIPKFDIEFIFPNVKISMTWKDRLLLGIPAIGAAIPLVVKILPQLLLIIGVILFVTFGSLDIEQLKVSEEEVRNVMPVLVTMLSLVVTLGGFAFKQYASYKNKKIKYQKNVTETLFFKNLASNTGAFHSLIDAAEEEECKEIILVYYHLLTSKSPLTLEQLDNRIEAWMSEKFGTKIDFDINGPLRNLEAIRGKINSHGSGSVSNSDLSLLRVDPQGNCHVLCLDEALKVMDYVWDNAFLYT